MIKKTAIYIGIIIFGSFSFLRKNELYHYKKKETKSLEKFMNIKKVYHKLPNSITDFNDNKHKLSSTKE